MQRRDFIHHTLCGLLGLLSGCRRAQQTSARHFVLRFQWEDFVVPEGVTWKLTWRSPYAPGEITPGYDVRIISGGVRIGERGEAFARAYSPSPGKTGLLDLQAASNEDAVVWLDSGARLTVANTRVRFHVQEINLSEP